MADVSLDLSALQQAYSTGTLTPSALIIALYPGLSSTHAVFIHLQPLEVLLDTCKALEAQPEGSRGPVWGVPFAVKDNVDVEGLPSTAACPSFKYIATASAPAVQALLMAGAIMVGKTNLDQFASGLVGTRSPYGIARNTFDSRFIPGGSSSGSAAAVSGGLVTFAIGTDTAGSGRVPAGLTGCVGIKPTVGSISTVGVVPACASLDCLSVFARSAADGAAVASIMASARAGAADAWRRPPRTYAPPGPGFRFALPSSEFLDWTGPGGTEVVFASSALFESAAAQLEKLGGSRVSVDFAPFAEVAAALYGGAFVAERYAGIRAFLDAKGGTAAAAAAGGASVLDSQLAVVNDERLLPVTRKIIAGAGKFSAADLYQDMARLAALRAAAAVQLEALDVLLVPTALHHYTVKEIYAQEGVEDPTWDFNAKLGRFTNFVNLLDLCGVAVPWGVVCADAEQLAGQGKDEAARRKHLTLTGRTEVVLPFGVTLISHAGADAWLAVLAGALHAASGLGCGPAGHGVEPYVAPAE